MIKIIFTFLIFLHLTPPTIHAQSDFDVSSNTSYVFNEKGRATVEQEVQITNNTEFMHAPNYTITLNIAGIEEMQVTGEEGASIPFTISDTQEDGKRVTVIFPQRTTGINTSQNFSLIYKTSTLASKLGESWEVNIPSVKSEKFTSTQVEVTVPQSFGKASIVKPQNVQAQQNTYTFDNDTLQNGGALLIFGEEEYYQLDLTYELENANFFPLKTEITLPPSLSYQEVIFKKIDPKPQKVYTDPDNNYLAQYTLSPHEKKQVNATVYIKVTPSNASKDTLSDQEKYIYTNSQKYWEQNSSIKDVAKQLNTAEDIYKYIVKNFQYNHSRNTETATRLGAQNTLKQEDNLVCLEFTDLFVSLARASNIPARSVEGYAYTSNPQTRPRSLVKDILHAWPEYYDEEKRAWIAVDPTWGNTTGGIDYFNSLDLSHITFVKKGHDSQYPIPAGGYKTDKAAKQVNVTFLQPEKFKKEESVKISATSKKIINPLGNAIAQLSVTNTGNTPINNKEVAVSVNENTPESYTIDNLPPFAEKILEIQLPTKALTRQKHQLKIQLDNHTVTKEVTSGTDTTTVFSMIGGGIFATLVFGFSLKFGGLYIQRRKK